MNYPSTVSTKLIMKAIDHYQDLGYELIDVPQCVDFDVSQHTKPEGVPELFHRGMKVYVASAEQSFIQMYKDGLIEGGMYCALTPCYRHESTLDNTHYSMFLKLELIVIGSSCSFDVSNDANSFLSRLDVSVGHDVVPTDEAVDSYDLVSKTGIELGSYGVRHMLDGTVYTYGTGIAEPRLSYVKDNQL